MTDREKFGRAFLLILVLAVSAVFFTMIARFVKPLLLAAIFSGLAHPLYRWVKVRIGGRQALASVTTLIILLLVVVVPLTGLLGMIAGQAFQVSEVVGPWIQERIQEPSRLQALIPEWVPFRDKLVPYRSQIMETLGELAKKTGTFLFNSLQATTRGTVSFLFSLVIMLYAMFFFLIDGRTLLDKILGLAPLSGEDKERIVDNFVSVTRATVKGTLVIGVVQGGLAGLAFAVVGIEGAMFWATIMAVLSVVPGIGAALVWVPAVVYLLATGQMAAGIGLMIWCAGVVGTADNVLRPRLVGKDTKMPDLLILLATLGGLMMFGAAGIIIGPIVAALFLTVWNLYGAAFRDLLPQPQASPDG